MYFGDHIEKEYMTPDGLIHLGREEAEHHIHLTYEELKEGYKRSIGICGIRTTEPEMNI